MQQKLFDIAQLMAQNRRYQPHQKAFDFLYTRASEDIALRLYGITRNFPVALNLTIGGSTVITEVLEQAPTVGKIIEAESFVAAHISKAQNQALPYPEETLPFEPESADLVVCGLNLQAINDLPGYLAQIRTILKPDGLFLGALIGGRSLHELRTVLLQAEEEVTGGVTPRVIPFADVKDMGSLLQRAGFALPVTDLDRFNVQYDTLFNLMADLRGMGASNILTQRKKTFTPRTVFMRAAQLYQEQFSSGDKINASCEIIHLTGWAPSPDQPKALKPGSGTVSLAQAVTQATKQTDKQETKKD